MIYKAATAASKRSKHAQPELRFIQIRHQMNVMMLPSGNGRGSQRLIKQIIRLLY
ncbi:conserved hypothetical protein [Vibrio jasicida]|uniref:Uncharacterized protein n=1 Tax=Vibrio jasicida TaxID=766224 RepID=A0AAU9QS33_9VIBR|nr:conserved hypothetical protein [Vibrio jasicida]CAH1600373.1 conserved hypothetical protein [Vibrio jasicida]